MYNILITTFLVLISVCVLLPKSGLKVWGAIEDYEDEEDEEDYEEDDDNNLLGKNNGENGKLDGWKSDNGNWESVPSEASDGKVVKPKEDINSKYFFWPKGALFPFSSATQEMYQDEIDIEPNTWYQLSAWMNVWEDDEECDVAVLRIEITDRNGNLLAFDQVSTNTPKWTHMFISIKTPPKAYYAKVICRGIRKQGGDIDSYFDDIRLVEVNAPFKEVTITGDNNNGKKGDTIQLKASDGVNYNAADYIWTSSDETKAKVDSKGKVTIVDSSVEVTIYARNKYTHVVGLFRINSNSNISDIKYTGSGFDPQKDGNSFIHYHLQPNKWSEEKTKYIGFLGRKNYEFSDASWFEKLTQNSSKGNKAAIRTYMRNTWDGSCHGVSATMALFKKGKLSWNDISDAKVSNYFELDRPSDNQKLDNWINYLQLSQLLDYGGNWEIATTKTINEEYINKEEKSQYYRDYYLNNPEFDDLDIFLKKMVEYTSSGHICILFSQYMDDDGEKSGHCVLVTGCNKDNGKYKVNVFDLNSVSETGFTRDEKGLLKKHPGVFKYIEIDDDFSCFEGWDLIYDKENSEYKYISMYLIDIEDIYKYHVEPLAEPVKKKNINVTFHRKNTFTIYNNEKYFIYDGKNFSGNLEIKGSDIISNGSFDMDDEDYMVIYIEPADGLVFKDLSEESDIYVHTEDDFASFSGKNIEEARIDFGKGVELKGTNMEFETYVLAEDDEETGKNLNLLKVSGNASSDIDISIDGSELIVSTEGTLENVTTAALSENEAVERAFTNVIGEFKIDSDAKVDSATEIAMVRTEGLTTIDTSGDIGVLGVSTTKNSNNISQAVIKLSKDTYAYSKDYKVTYKNNKNVGTATLTIKGIEDYNGTVSRTFKIVPKGTSLSKVSVSSKKVSVKWKKQTKSVTGYEIQYSSSKSFTKKTSKTVTVSGAKKTKTTLSGLKSGKKYYFRVRTYKVVNGKKYYSGWSKVKNVKIK